MSLFAAGTRAWAICDRCGFRFLKTKLRTESKTNLLVCRSCLDIPGGRDSPKIRTDDEKLSRRRP